MNLPSRRSTKRKHSLSFVSTMTLVREYESYPNVSPGASEINGIMLPSALLNETVLPHHVWIVFSPMLPFLGYWRMKKIRIAETATPASKAADKTSTTCTRQGKGEESKTSVSPRHESTENMKHKTHNNGRRISKKEIKKGGKQGKRRKEKKANAQLYFVHHAKWRLRMT